jgi:hypothetical protein
MDQQETIKLPIAILSDLVSNCLVDLSDSNTEPINPAIEAIETTTGKTVNTIVISQSEEKNLSPKELDFLHNIMKACKLQIADYAILTNRQADSLDYQSTFKKFNQKQLILFGLDPADIGLPINFPQFQVQSFQQVKYLAAPGLDAIEGDKALKMQLWQCLKQLFPA